MWGIAACGCGPPFVVDMLMISGASGVKGLLT